jgi:hypothetical protein
MHGPSTFRFLRFAFLAGLLVVFVRCSSDESKSPAPSERPTVTTRVPSASGGRVVSADGRAVLTIPPGALAVDTTITVRELAGTHETVTDVYDFGPDGLLFNVPARLDITVDAKTAAESPTMRLGMTQGQELMKTFTVMPSTFQPRCFALRLTIHAPSSHLRRDWWQHPLELHVPHRHVGLCA